MKKKLVIALAAALVLCCAGIGVWAAGNYGSEDDPLVAMSYLDEVKEQLQSDFDDALNEAAQGAGAASGAFVSLNLSESAVSLDAGGEVLCLESGATATATLVDATGGGSLAPGETLAANHLYIAAADTLIYGTGEVLVRGVYEHG